MEHKKCRQYFDLYMLNGTLSREKLDTTISGEILFKILNNNLTESNDVLIKIFHQLSTQKHKP